MAISDVSYLRLPVGVVVGDRYRVGSVIGKGGSGLVHEAMDLTTGTLVALKVLNTDVRAHRSAVARYEREARAAASIGHPNICAANDVGLLEDGRPYLVMELLSGQTLADRIRDKGALPFLLTITVLTQTLTALGAAHAKMIIHRDIKPANVFLANCVEGTVEVKLLDFGVAKSLEQGRSDLALTRTGMVVGTPMYMAPEQARGLPLDHRVDLYACGLLLFEMLTGRRPFQAANYTELMDLVLHEQPPDPRDYRPATPTGLAAIVAKALEKDRNRRYADARSFRTAIAAQQTAVVAGLGAEEIERIAKAVRHPKSSLRPSVEPASSDDGPYFGRTLSPLHMVSGDANLTDNETTVMPFVRSDVFKHPVSSLDVGVLSSTVPSSDQTEVRMEPTWLNPESDDQSPSGRLETAVTYPAGGYSSDSYSATNPVSGVETIRECRTGMLPGGSAGTNVSSAPPNLESEPETPEKLPAC